MPVESTRPTRTPTHDPTATLVVVISENLLAGGAMVPRTSSKSSKPVQPTFGTTTTPPGIGSPMAMYPSDGPVKSSRLELSTFLPSRLSCHLAVAPPTPPTPISTRCHPGLALVFGFQLGLYKVALQPPTSSCPVEVSSKRSQTF